MALVRGDSILVNGVQCPVKRAAITLASNGVNALIAAVAGKKIRCIAASWSYSGTVNVKFQSHVTPTDVTGLWYGVVNVNVVLPLNEYGWFESLIGEALDVNLSAGVAIGGCFDYIECT